MAWGELIDRRMMKERADFIEAVQWGTSGDPKALRRLVKKMREQL